MARQLDLFPTPRRERVPRVVDSTERPTPWKLAETIRKDHNHPLTMVLPDGERLPLHPDAVRVTSPDEEPSPVRCGNCAYADLLRPTPASPRMYWKCTYDDGTREFGNGRFITPGAASDVRNWYPACVHWVLARLGARQPAH